MPFLTPHHGICGNWNMTPGDREVRKHPLHLFPVSCGGASSSRTQMHLRQNRHGEKGLCVGALCPHTEQLLQWSSPELCGILLGVVALGAEWSCWGRLFLHAEFSSFSSILRGFYLCEEVLTNSITGEAKQDLD